MRPILVAAVRGTVVAIVLAVIVFFVARATGETFTVTPPGQGTIDVVVGAVISSTVIGGVIGAVLAAIARRTSRPRTVLLAVGAVGTLASFAQPATATSEVSTIVWLCLMHVVVAVAILSSLAAVLPAVRGRTA